MSADGSATTYDDVIQAYADALERGVETLTVAEKRQAFLNAVLSGDRVEPFATWCEQGDKIIERLSPGTKTLNQIVREINE